MKRKRGPTAAPAWKVGDAVRAKFRADKPDPKFRPKWESQGCYFPGSICAVYEDGAVDVMFNDGYFEKRVLMQHVKRGQHKVLRQWRKTGHELIGRRVRRHFDGKGEIRGTIQVWCPASEPDAELEWPMLFQVVHDDDDEEALSMNAVRASLMPDVQASLLPAAGSMPAAALRPAAEATPSTPPPAARAAANLARPAEQACDAGLADLGNEGMEPVREVLRRVRLIEYADAFEGQGYDDLEWLCGIAAKKDGPQWQSMVADTGLKPGHALKLAALLPAAAADLLDEQS